MAVKTVQAGQANYTKGMAGASAAYTAGTAACLVNPMQLAAQAIDKAVANYTAAAPKMAAKLQATPVSDWKAACAGAGARLTSGGAKGASKWAKNIAPYAAVWSQMGPAAKAAGDDPVAKFSAALAIIQQVKASQA